jgi:hypothetical protein
MEPRERHRRVGLSGLSRASDEPHSLAFGLLVGHSSEVHEEGRREAAIAERKRAISRNAPAPRGCLGAGRSVHESDRVTRLDRQCQKTFEVGLIGLGAVHEGADRLRRGEGRNDSTDLAAQ